MDSETFSERVGQIGLAPVPKRHRHLVENVAMLVGDDVPDETRRVLGLGAEESLLGLYQGVPLTERGALYGTGELPDTITLYRLPILEEAGTDDPAAIERVIRETIWHEVAHHFGLEEHEVEERERSREDRAAEDL